MTKEEFLAYKNKVRSSMEQEGLIQPSTEQTSIQPTIQSKPTPMAQPGMEQYGPNLPEKTVDKQQVKDNFNKLTNEQRASTLVTSPVGGLLSGIGQGATSSWKGTAMDRLSGAWETAKGVTKLRSGAGSLLNVFSGNNKTIQEDAQDILKGGSDLIQGAFALPSAAVQAVGAIPYLGQAATTPINIMGGALGGTGKGLMTGVGESYLGVPFEQMTPEQQASIEQGGNIASVVLPSGGLMAKGVKKLSGAITKPSVVPPIEPPPSGMAAPQTAPLAQSPLTKAMETPMIKEATAPVKGTVSAKAGRTAKEAIRAEENTQAGKFVTSLKVKSKKDLAAYEREKANTLDGLKDFADDTKTKDIEYFDPIKEKTVNAKQNPATNVVSAIHYNEARMDLLRAAQKETNKIAGDAEVTLSTKDIINNLDNIKLDENTSLGKYLTEMKQSGAPSKNAIYDNFMKEIVGSFKKRDEAGNVSELPSVSFDHIDALIKDINKKTGNTNKRTVSTSTEAQMLELENAFVRGVQDMYLKKLDDPTVAPARRAINMKLRNAISLQQSLYPAYKKIMEGSENGLNQIASDAATMATLEGAFSGTVPLKSLGFTMLRNWRKQQADPNFLFRNAMREMGVKIPTSIRKKFMDTSKKGALATRPQGMVSDKQQIEQAPVDKNEFLKTQSSSKNKQDFIK